MKTIIVFISLLAVLLGINHFLEPQKPKIDIITYLGFEECKFQLEYGVDSTFSETDINLINSAAAAWIIASDKKLCFLLYTRDVKWYENFTFPYDEEATIYNAQGGIWQQIGLYLNPYCQRKGCVGQAYRSRDMFLTYYSIYLVALHEFGHTLGLDHSPNGEDIMYPNINATKVSKEDERVLRCLLEHKEPLLWMNSDCIYKKVGKSNER
jgi:hypothetical protein